MRVLLIVLLVIGSLYLTSSSADAISIQSDLSVVSGVYNPCDPGETTECSCESDGQGTDCCEGGGGNCGYIYCICNQGKSSTQFMSLRNL